MQADQAIAAAAAESYSTSVGRSSVYQGQQQSHNAPAERQAGAEDLRSLSCLGAAYSAEHHRLQQQSHKAPAERQVLAEDFPAGTWPAQQLFITARPAWAD